MTPVVDAHNHALLTHARTKQHVFPAVDVTRLAAEMHTGGVIGMGLIVGGTISFPVRESRSAWLGTVDGLHRFWAGLEASGHDLAVIQDARDLGLLGEDLPGVLLAIEGWDCCLDAPAANPVDALAQLAELGVRSIQPLGRSESRAFAPENDPSDALDLSQIGRDLIVKARQLGMVLDVAHFRGDEPAFAEILDLADGAVIASHHSCQAITDNPRALSNAAIRAIADTGGVIGIHAGRNWLSNTPEQASIDEFLQHVTHVIEVAGVAHVAIGTDHVDVRAMPIDLPNDMYIDGFQGPATMGLFSEAVQRLGLTESERENVLWKNVFRVWQAALLSPAESRSG